MPKMANLRIGCIRQKDVGERRRRHVRQVKRAEMFPSFYRCKSYCNLKYSLNKQLSNIFQSSFDTRSFAHLRKRLQPSA